MHRLVALPVLAVIVLILAACSIAAPHATHTPAAKFATHYGQSASVIASHVKACNDVSAADIGKGDQSGMASTATCTILGHKVCFDSWSDAAGGIESVVTENAKPIVYASGKGWSAFVCDDPSLQAQMTNDAGFLFDQAMSGKTPPPADVDGEESVAKAVVAAVNGDIHRAFTS